MTESAAAAKALYMRQYREKHREKINEYHRRWNKDNPEKVRSYSDAYWEKKAEVAEHEES